MIRYTVTWNRHTQRLEFTDESGARTNIPRVAGGGAPSAHATTHKLGGSDSIRLDEFALPTASIDINQQQMLKMRLENRTSDPGSPAEGEIWLRTDL